MADVRKSYNREGTIGYLCIVIESCYTLVQLRKEAAIEGEPPVRSATMRAIQRAPDPHGILNPGAVIGPEDGAFG